MENSCQIEANGPNQGVDVGHEQLVNYPRDGDPALTGEEVLDEHLQHLLQAGGIAWQGSCGEIMKFRVDVYSLQVLWFTIEAEPENLEIGSPPSVTRYLASLLTGLGRQLKIRMASEVLKTKYVIDICLKEKAVLK